MIGHIFPIWLGFSRRQGRGNWSWSFRGVDAVCCLLRRRCVCSATLLVTRYVSLASITVALMIPVFVLIYGLFEPGPDMVPNALLPRC